MDTSTSYLGLRLPHPFIAGASPFGFHLDSVKRLEDAECAAVVLHSLFEEQVSVQRDARLGGVDAEETAFADLRSYYPATTDYPHSPDAYAEHVMRLKRDVRIPIIASLNGTSAQAWLRFAQVLEQAGADALELNLYQVPTNVNTPGAAIEYELTEIVKDVKRLVKIPVAVKLTPFYTNFANVARQMDQAGADALVFFNRFYQAWDPLESTCRHASLSIL